MSIAFVNTSVDCLFGKIKNHFEEKRSVWRNQTHQVGILKEQINSLRRSVDEKVSAISLPVLEQETANCLKRYQKLAGSLDEMKAFKADLMAQEKKLTAAHLNDAYLVMLLKINPEAAQKIVCAQHVAKKYLEIIASWRGQVNSLQDQMQERLAINVKFYLSELCQITWKNNGQSLGSYQRTKNRVAGPEELPLEKVELAGNSIENPFALEHDEILNTVEQIRSSNSLEELPIERLSLDPFEAETFDARFESCKQKYEEKISSIKQKVRSLGSLNEHLKLIQSAKDGGFGDKEKMDKEVKQLVAVYDSIREDFEVAQKLEDLFAQGDEYLKSLELTPEIREILSTLDQTSSDDLIKGYEHLKEKQKAMHAWKLEYSAIVNQMRSMLNNEVAARIMIVSQ